MLEKWKRVALVSCWLFVAGCGSEGSSFISGPAAPPSGTTTMIAARAPFVARFSPGVDLAGVTVRLEDLQGNVLGSALSGVDGRVAFPLDALPRDGRLVAVLPNSAIEMAVEFRGLDPSKQEPAISLVSTLVSRLTRQGMSLPQAETRVLRLLGLPDGYPLAYGEPNPFFSSLALLRAAQQQGGWQTFSSALLARAETPVTPRTVGVNGVRPLYPLRKDLLLQSFNDLGDPGLVQLARGLQTRVKSRIGFTDGELARIPGLGSDAELGTAGQFVLGLSQGVTGNVIQGIAVDIMGAVLSAAGMQSATQQQIDAIEQELAALLSTLTAFVDAARTAELQAQIRQVEDLFTGTRNTADNLVQSIAGIPVTGQPSSTPSSLLQLASALRDGGAVSINTLRTANIRLGGRNGLLRAYLQDTLKGRYGLNAEDWTPNTPWFANLGSYTQFQEFYLHFAQDQMLALYLLSEDGHVGFPGTTTPVAALQQVQAYFDQTMVALKEQAQLMPWPMSNSTALADVQFNSIYARGIFPITNNPGAIQTNPHQETFFYPDGSQETYQTFGIADQQHLNWLQQRGSQCPSPGQPGVSLTDPNYNSASQVGGVNVTSNQPAQIGITTAGLAALGFENFDQPGYANADLPYDGQMWSDHDNDYYGLNTMTSQALDNGSLESRPYIFSANLAALNANGVGATASPGACLQWGVPNFIFTVTPQPATTVPIEVDFVLPFTGTPGTFTIPANSLEFVATIGYDLSVGGSVVVGDQNPTSIQAPVYLTSGNVNTAPTNSNQPPNKLREIVNWSSSNPKALKFYNIPGLGGYATPLQPGVNVTVTASMMTPAGTRIARPFAYTTPSAIAPHQLQSLQILPRNQIYGSTPSQGSSGTFPYYCVAYYNDLTFADVSTQVQWSVTSPNAANAQMVNTGLGVSLSMNQPPQSTPTPYNLTITATLNNQEGTPVTDSTQIQIVPPVGNP